MTSPYQIFLKRQQNLAMTQSPYPGARLWAINELGVLRNPDSVPALLRTLHDPMLLVREQAIRSLGMLCQTLPEIRTEVMQELQHVSSEQEGSQKTLEHVLQQIRECSSD